MQSSTQVAVLKRVLQLLAEQRIGEGAPQTTLDPQRYVDPARHAAEQRLLQRSPILVGRASDLAVPGQFLTLDLAGRPVLLVRGTDDRLRAFLNVCRHRGSLLCDQPSGTKKAFVCRYHAWSYQLDGQLLHIPLRGAFPTLQDRDHGLIELPLSIWQGFLLLSATPEIPATLPAVEPLSRDLDAMTLADHVVLRRESVERACNWKLVLDAFLEGYHVKSLHRESIARFFHEAGVVFDYQGPHVRSVGARRNLQEILAGQPESTWDIRQVATVYYFLFPNTVLVFHPDWVSHIVVLPLAPDRCRCIHTMLVPATPQSDAQRAHYERSFALIHGQVFLQEDLAICESVQRGLGALGSQPLALGALEHPIFHFHLHLDRAIAAL